MLKCTQFSKERILGIISFNNFGSPDIYGWDYFWVFVLTETNNVEQYMTFIWVLLLLKKVNKVITLFLGHLTNTSC